MSPRSAGRIERYGWSGVATLAVGGAALAATRVLLSLVPGNETQVVACDNYVLSQQVETKAFVETGCYELLGNIPTDHLTFTSPVDKTSVDHRNFQVGYSATEFSTVNLELAQQQDSRHRWSGAILVGLGVSTLAFRRQRKIHGLARPKNNGSRLPIPAKL